MSQEARSRMSKFKQPLIQGAVVIGVFALGLGIGSERISLGESGIYRASLQNSSQKLDYAGVEEVYDKLQQGFDGQLEADKLEDGLKEGLVKAAGDPFTEYLNAEQSQEFNEQLSGSFQGIGAELSKEEQSIIIVSPIEGFPAEKAGLKARDIISKINDESAYDISVTDAVNKIRGEKGTNVKLEIIRDGKALTFDIVRDQISIPSVKTEITADNIGIIEISRFGEDTTTLVQQAAKDMKAKNVRGVVLDMRGNPGGLLDASVGVANVWLNKGSKILEEKRGDTVVKTFTATANPILNGVPTVVLVNEGSASASEIVAGALRDNKAATIIGQKTFGKGSVQELRELRDGGTLKVTIARWFTPAGRNIDKEGIEPDQAIEITDEQAAANQDPQKDAALAKLKQ